MDPRDKRDSDQDDEEVKGSGRLFETDLKDLLGFSNSDGEDSDESNN